MSSPANSTTSTGGRFYRWRGEEFVSVTTVLGVLAKPALTGWAAKVTAEAAVELADSLSSLVKADREGTLKLLKRRHRERKTSAADLGSAVHAAAEALALGAPLPANLPQEAMPYVEGFLLYWESVKPEPLRLESTVYSRTNNYAGTADKFARIDGTISVVDYKTGKSVWPEVALQLAAYANADFIGYHDEEISLPEVEAGYAVHIGPHAFNLVPVKIDRPVFESFLAARRLWEWQRTAASLLGVS